MELNKASFFTLVFMVSSFAVTAQTEIFKVLASKGDNKVSSSNGAWTNMTIGKKLYKTDKITIGANGYLGLAHSCGKTIEIKKPGTYEVNKLSSEVASQNKGVCKKYVDFVVGEMTSQEEDMSKNKYKYMAVTGSVDRGGAVISCYIPDKAKVLPAKVTLHWEVDSSRTDAVYLVTVSDLYGEGKKVHKTKNPFIELDLSNTGPLEMNTLLWYVKYDGVAGSEYKEKQLIVSPADKSASLIKEIEAMKKDLGEESALTNLVMASYFAEKDLVIDAIHSYEKAISLQPEVESFKMAYTDFLINKKLVLGSDSLEEKDNTGKLKE